MIKNLINLARRWEDDLDLGLVAFVARIPGLLWGFHFLSNAPFVYLSFDEWYVTNSILVWLANPATRKMDYVWGFGREICIARPIAWLLGSSSDPLNLLFSTRLLNILLGSATVVLTYRLARLLKANRLTALMAGGLLALAPLHVAQSGYATPTISVVFWVYLALVSFLSFCTEPKPVFWLIGCAAAGISIAVKFGFVSLIPLVYLLFRINKKYLLKIGGVAICAAAFYYFNFGDLPWTRLSLFKSFLVTDNFHERVHPRWFNPIMFGIDLIPCLGLPTFVCFVAGARNFWKKAAINSADSAGRVDRFACVELPMAAYFLSICTMTSIFMRHLVLLAPFLCIVAAHGFQQLKSGLAARGYEKAARSLLLVIGIYQIISVGWLAKQHATERVSLGLDWISKNVPAGKKVYVAERTKYDLVWKGEVPASIVTPSFAAADYLLVPEMIVWRFKRNVLNPLTSSPRQEEIYQYSHIKDPEFLQDLVNGRAPFKRVAYFPAFEIVPEFILFKALFNTFNFEYGDVSVYKRTGP